jgi:hypothetical protein
MARVLRQIESPFYKIVWFLRVCEPTATEFLLYNFKLPKAVFTKRNIPPYTEA